MRISLALAAAALCFSTVGCTCQRCPYMGYPIPPRISMLDAPDAVEEFPDAPPAKPVKTEKGEKGAAAEKTPQVTSRTKTHKPAAEQPVATKPVVEQRGPVAQKAVSLATRSGLMPAKKQTVAAPAKAQVAVAKPAAKPTTPKREAVEKSVAEKNTVEKGAEKGAPQLLATARPQPTVRAASSKPANYTPVSQARREAKPNQVANGGPALAAVIVVAPPKATMAQTPAVKTMATEASAPVAAPRLKQPGIVAGRGAKPRAEQPKHEEPKKPQLQAGETPASGAKQVVHLEPGS